MAKVARQIAIVAYANPSLVPNGVRKIALVTTATGKIQRVTTQTVANPAAAPANKVVYGAITYATQNLVPNGLMMVSEQT